MFRPDSNRDRTDYSGILMPPDGYRLDRAVGTTYSLDLEALTAVAICLGLSEETDSKLMQNPRLTGGVIIRRLIHGCGGLL